jgi:ectoine hydroxylase-related dioxygenase (phytanoyl-CoA dioxygenase family)
MAIEHLSASASPERLTEILERDGCAVVDELAPRAQLERLREELAAYLEATPVGSDDFSGRRTRRTGGLVARSPTARELVTHPLVLETVGRVLSRATRFQLHLTQMIAIGPGEPGQPIHRDQWAFDFFPFPKGYEVQCNTIWSITDFTAANGATRVIPGSHRFDDRLSFAECDTEPAEMAAGSVLFYTGSLYHGGGANRSDAVRLGCNLTYTAAWLRQEENQYLSVPREIARQLPEPLLRLIGYARGAYALGYVDDLRDPIEVLRPGAGDPGLGNLAHAAERVAPARAAASTRGAGGS